MKLNERLLELRKASGKSQKECADELGVSNSKYNKWENGVNSPDYETLCELARFYNTTTDYLLGMTDVKTTDTSIKAMCEYTGLSQNSIEQLHVAKYENYIPKVAGEPIIVSLIDALLLERYAPVISLCYRIQDLLAFASTANGFAQDSNFDMEKIDEIKGNLFTASRGFFWAENISSLVRNSFNVAIECFEEILSDFTGYQETKDKLDNLWEKIISDTINSDGKANGEA